MIPKFREFRYFGDNSSENNITRSELISGSIFTQNIPTITQLGVRAIPGTKFYINGNTNPVVIGFLGVLELDLSDGGSITSLKFDTQSINNINENINGGYIIIDILGLGGE